MHSDHSYRTTPQAPIHSGFGPHTAAREVLRGRDLMGKTALVTGGYSGIGLEATRALAEAGATVIVPARTPAQKLSRLPTRFSTKAPQRFSDAEATGIASKRRLLSSEKTCHVALRRHDTLCVRGVCLFFF
jgi:NADP-dependent 3-hydroxy acid dehydrogenase YdfG